jgi:NMD protein affecting ribosome stability and mRNA decay
MTEKLFCKNCMHEVKYHNNKLPHKTELGFCERCSECRKEREKTQGWNGAI